MEQIERISEILLENGSKLLLPDEYYRKHRERTEKVRSMYVRFAYGHLLKSGETKYYVQQKDGVYTSPEYTMFMYAIVKFVRKFLN